ncbi:MAG TPA: hypothetical protein PK867_24180 [Pirellulales bacterium]|nr:hypothetical protein [Pirellulales bacterium]
MSRETLRASVAAVGLSLREPEEFALVWQREGAPYCLPVWLALAATALFGVLVYGLTMGIHAGPQTMLAKSLLFSIAAGLAWVIPLPALYILNSLSGSRLRASSTLLAALVTVSWGGLALIASVPINWFFSVAVPSLPAELVGPRWAAWLVAAVNWLVLIGVGVAMADVFCRIVERLEPTRGRQPGWILLLVGAIGFQMAYVFGLLTPVV